MQEIDVQDVQEYEGEKLKDKKKNTKEKRSGEYGDQLESVS